MTTFAGGNIVYEDDQLKLILTENGYIERNINTGAYSRYYYQKDRLGNNRIVMNSSGAVVQLTNYYPSGTTIAESPAREDQGVQPYKFGSKELDRSHGLDFYDFEARQFDPTIMRFTRPDPLQEKYYSISPYAYALNNPVRNIDLRGDSVTVLNLGTGTNQHMAILIQNDAGKWQYYSVNGDNVYNATNGIVGGRPFDDIAVGEFDSPQQFLDSQYNSEGDKTDKKGTNSYGMTEGYVLPTTPEQDKTIAGTFTNVSTNEDYSIFSNNCATAVQKSLNAVGINTTTTRKETDSFVSTTPKVYNSWWPSTAFKAIRTNNLNGIYLRSKR